MQRDEIQTDDIGKTGALIGLGALLLSPLIWADSKIGLSALIVGATALLYGAHEVGKEKRPLENKINQANTFFGGMTGDKSTEVHNTLANITKGGAALFDELFPESQIKPK
ncbi:hypothetical protein [uncultured Legionella sp.]|uniref:hypothetical protein n=1 Tax=uncultured Legionella sp. TaxID=210934 RepID=UPI00261D7EBF|nr:hypothetical protein [uncultured Legionella sp.]